MSACNCKTLLCSSLSSLKSERTLHLLRSPPPPTLSLSLSSLLHHHRHHPPPLTLTPRCCYTSLQTAPSLHHEEQPITEHQDQCKDNVKQLLTNHDGVSSLMKMERKPLLYQPEPQARWFPYLDRYIYNISHVM